MAIFGVLKILSQKGGDLRPLLAGGGSRALKVENSRRYLTGMVDGHVVWPELMDSGGGKVCKGFLEILTQRKRGER